MFETFFGLSGNPFQLSPDPSFLFESKGHRKAFSYLQYGLYQGEGFIVITGEIGAGKTTLVRALLRDVDPRRVAAAQLVSTQLDAADLLRAVAIAFGLPVKDAGKAELLGSIEAYLTSLVPRNRRALLVIDEAQNLNAQSMEELRMLSNFQIGERTLLQSFLVGQPELRDLMKGPSMQQLRQRIAASYHLGPMDADETRAYVEHRLRHVGWNDNPSIDAGAFLAIHQATGGIPRRINALCNRVLLGAYLAERHRIGEDDAEAAVRELSQELGAEEQASAPRTLALAAESERAVGVVRPFALSSIAARLDRLEANVNAILELLRSKAPPIERRSLDKTVRR